MAIEDVKCPTCGGKMLRRTGHASGRPFWGCADFPKCRGTRNVDGLSREEELAERDHGRGAGHTGRWGALSPSRRLGFDRREDE